MSARIAIVTGASRPTGLGVEIARQLARSGVHVVLTARRASDAAERADALREEGLDVEGFPLDLDDPQSRAALVRHVGSHGRVDILVNNAAIGWDMDTPTLEASPEDVMAAFRTNVLGPWALVQDLKPLLLASPAARVVNVSSEAASFGGGYGMRRRGPVLGGYAVTKAALNALTMKLSVALADTPIKVNSVCPGWVATYPGTAEMGARPVSEGASGVVWAALLPDDGPTGGFFRDGEPLPW